jgi:hypothetical protein
MVFAVEQSIYVVHYYLKTGSYKDWKNTCMEKFSNGLVPTKSTIH